MADAVVYHVYRSTVTPILGGLLPTASPGSGASILANIDASAAICDISPQACELLQFLGTDVGVPGPFVWTAATTDPFYVETQPTPVQSMYFVRAQRLDGSLSGPSNVVGGASTAAPITFPAVDDEMLTMLERDELGVDALRALTMVRRASFTLGGGNVPAAKHLLDIAESIVEAQKGLSITAAQADDLSLMIYRLKRNVQLADWGLIPVTPLM